MPTPRPKFTHGQDAAKLLLALWLFVSPWMLNYTQGQVAVWNGDIVGIVVAAFSIAAMFKFTTWEEWINIVAGFWLIASPWVLDYASFLGNTATLPATANHLAVGLAIVFLSFRELNLWERANEIFQKRKGVKS